MTNRYGLIGFPLGHSFSKKYFTNKFLNQSIEAVYDLFPLEDVSQLHTILKEFPDLRGLNVTIPHKQKVIPLLDSISGEAAKINAVNTIRVSRVNGKPFLEGYNTDAPAFEAELLEFTDGIENKAVEFALILGTGGASAAVAYVLDKLEWEYQFVSRNANKNNTITYADLSESIVSRSKLIINCTPLGMHPDIETLPQIPYSAVTPEHYLFDLVYNPELTAFLIKGKQQGAHTQNGLGMLHRQAELAWDIWQK